MIFDLLDQIGNCQLYHDYRSGSFRDWSGNGNDGTPSSAVSLCRGGALLNYTGSINISGNTAIDFGSKDAATLILLFPDGYREFEGAINYLFAQENTTDYLGATDGSAYFRIDGINSFVAGNSHQGMSYFSGVFVDGSPADFYKNGVYESTGANTLNKRVSASTDGFTVCTVATSLIRQVPCPIGGALMFDKALTATEHAELFAALEGVRWPSKVYSHARNPQTVDPDETGLVLGCDMRAVGGKVADVSGNNDPGTVTTALTVRDALGDALEFNGVDSLIDFGTDASTNLTGEITMTAWIKLNAIPAVSDYFIRRDNYGFWIDSSGQPRFYTRNAADTGADSTPSGAALLAGVWAHVAAVFDATAQTKTVYTNGAPGTPVAKTDGGVPSSPSSNLYLGSSTTAFINGSLANVKLYNRALSADEIAAEYAKGAKTVQFKTSWGARETSAAVASGNITNTPFEVINGTFDIVTTTINGKLTKALKCSTAGPVAFSTSVFKTGYTEAAYGAFEFSVYVKSGNALRVGVVGNQASATTGAGFNGYEVVLTTAFFLFRRNSGSGTILARSADGYVSQDNWHNCRLTRNVSGEFTAYFNGVLVDVTGGSGTNPVTDTTYTESKFVVFDFDAGDMIALGALDGSYNFKKRLGVYNG